MEKIKAGIIGATGMVGQRLITLLADHPYFEIAALFASARSAGKPYREAVEGRWKMAVECPGAIAEMPLEDAADIPNIAKKCDMVFCAVNMPKEEVKVFEEDLAKAEIPVVSCNSAHRGTPDVPMLIPEINPGHVDLIPIQKKRLGTRRGFIAAKPNCSIQSYVPLLHPLMEFGPTEIAVSTYQAISGAGKTFKEWPEILDNIVPNISGEEEKSEKEPLKVWGRITDHGIENNTSIRITAQCLRVPVADGHTASVFVRFAKKPTKEEILSRWASYRGLPQEMELPSAPKQFITYFEEEDRPQAHLDRMTEKGMGICVGRLREDPIFDYKFVGLSHNTLRGAAGGAVEAAELLCRLGYFAR